MERLARALKGDAPYTVGEKFETEFGCINYVVEGNKLCDRPLIVCLHGLNASLAQYLTISHLFSSLGYRVLRCDLLGHGLSSTWRKLPKSSGHFLAAILGSINDLIKHVEGQVTQVDVIGFSMGGYLAVEFRNAYPRLVRRLVLISPAGLIDQKPTALKLFDLPFIGSCARHTVCALYVLLSILFVRSSKIAKFYTSIENKADDEIIDPRAAQWREISSRNLKSAVLYTRMLRLWNNEDAFRNLSTEDPLDVLFCWGALDELTPYKDSENFLRTTLPRSEWEIYLNCHHVLLEEAVPHIYRRIYGFLKDSVELCRTPVAARFDGDNTVITTPATELESLGQVTPIKSAPQFDCAGSSNDTTTSLASWVPASNTHLEPVKALGFCSDLSSDMTISSGGESLTYVQQRIRQFERRNYFNAQSAPQPQHMLELEERGIQSACCFKTDSSRNEFSNLSTSPCNKNDEGSHIDALIRRTTSTRETNYSMVSFIMAAKRTRSAAR